MYFEEFNQGDKFTTRSRVVTSTDIDTFAISTGAINPLFLDDKYARKMGFERRNAPGLLTTSLTVGLAYSLGLFDHSVALLGIDVKFLASVNAGDEIKGTVEVVEKREAKLEDKGVVVFKLGCQNQEGKQLLEITRFSCLVQRKS